MSEYQTVSCDFYDQIVQMIGAKQRIVIDFQDENRLFYKLEAMPLDIVTKSKSEYLILETKQEIRLDYLHKIGDVVSPMVLDRGNSCAM